MMIDFLRKNINTEAKDENQRKYREFFGIVDKFLIHYTKDEVSQSGYIVYIDYDNDLDYVVKGHEEWCDEDNKAFANCIAKLQIAEATPYLNLSEEETLAFKRKLGGGYILALQGKFEGIDEVIIDALTFLRQRNVEAARTRFLESANLIATIFVVGGLGLYLYGNTNKWYYGVLFGILGAYTSVWTRYGRMMLTGLATRWLHYLESTSRLFIGAIFGVVAMFAIKCGLIFSDINPSIELFAYSLASFAAGFSERFIPSLIEKIVNNQTEDNEKTNHHH